MLGQRQNQAVPLDFNNLGGSTQNNYNNNNNNNYNQMNSMSGYPRGSYMNEMMNNNNNNNNNYNQNYANQTQQINNDYQEQNFQNIRKEDICTCECDCGCENAKDEYELNKSKSITQKVIKKNYNYNSREGYTK